MSSAKDVSVEDCIRRGCALSSPMYAESLVEDVNERFIVPEGGGRLAIAVSTFLDGDLRLHHDLLSPGNDIPLEFFLGNIRQGRVVHRFDKRDSAHLQRSIN